MRAFLSGLTAKAAIALVAVASISFVATAPAAKASAVTYDFVSSTIVSMGSAGTATITGKFSYDSTTDALTAINVKLSGSIFAGTYTYTYAPWNGASYIGLMYAANSASDNTFALLFLEFADPLNGAAGVDSLVGGEAYNGPGNFVFTSSTGGVEIASTPLPAALPLFATGLGVLDLLLLRRKRKAAALAA